MREPTYLRVSGKLDYAVSESVYDQRGKGGVEQPNANDR